MNNKFLYLVLIVTILFIGCKEKPSANTQVELITSNEEPSRPNILIILCDDLGYADVGFNGSKDIVTPSLDKLAENGTKFSAAYVAHPFCGPSRTSIMTGRYSHKIGAQFNLPPNREQTIEEGITLDETFISKVLDDAGYYTGIMGKWHLGSSPDYHPNKRGFDDFYGFLGGGHNYFPEQYRKEYEKQKKNGNKVIWDYLHPLEHNGKEVKETEYITDALSREATRFISEAGKKEDPFFLYLSYNAPHVPLEAKEEDLKLFEHIKDIKRRTYAAMVYAVDRGVNIIVESLKNTGQLDNTLIVFFSDNGGKLGKGANNYPLKEGKGSTMEGGYRTPMFFHWPNTVAAGNVFEYPISALDLYPTIANLAGAKIPEGKILDGKDIWADFMENKDAHKDDMILAMRHREGYTDIGARENEWKILRTNQTDWKLFNIEKDISESNDLSEKYPEKLEELVKKAEKWSESNVEPRWYTPKIIGKMWKDDNMGDFKDTFTLQNK